ncbi:MAG TPA: nuclease [Erythrobacter sp.]|jgi:endonuclease YncB( thermonuclease family)|uniref:Endonuclease YncB(Thermonuclease family) n=1 Tax=Qipengyuania citrea TaxID=225971 RepID=A0A6I4UCA7_9SPHN|nr:thermonuclease family protein [Qipengyuania citrea]MAG42504.1 nuclease [Erythrobacteraceae bacterium]HAW36790.1 nuclease [Erythrobacter sp.]MCD1591013.1 thermonuclease family protein [Qipengyuania citrea]MDQ0567089.1 endonuclease YncB(thermonuclease family) [Qipengyuania citrea]MXP36570.1 thermonuclease family protein [Qipengyuania citrea]|tara:strand:+ start:209 stop:556 length:348 start_codon:yes stop_codon:yes gene_type:complete
MLLIAAALAVCAPGPRDHCVHDGDTVWLDGEKIRIADIDTPELNGECASERKLALRARNRLVELLNVGPFDISRSGTDRYGRTLAVLHRSGNSIGGQLVAEGLARIWSGRREPWC